MPCKVPYRMLLTQKREGGYYNVGGCIVNNRFRQVGGYNIPTSITKTYQMKLNFDMEGDLRLVSPQLQDRSVKILR